MNDDHENSEPGTSASVDPDADRSPDQSSRDQVEEMEVGRLMLIAKEAAIEIPDLLMKVDGVDIWDKSKLEVLYKNKKSKLNFITRPAGTLENRTQSPLSKLNYSGGVLDRMLTPDLAKKMRQLATLRMTGNDPLEEESDEILEMRKGGIRKLVRRILGWED